MKTMKYVLICTLLIASTPFLKAQSADIPSEIISAFNDGNASELTSFLNTNVELVIGNQNDVFSKQQATAIITAFFKNNKVNSFQVLHKGNKESASFAIGELDTDNGTFRVYLLIHTSDNQSVIQQLRIESSNE